MDYAIRLIHETMQRRLFHQQPCSSESALVHTGLSWRSHLDIIEAYEEIFRNCYNRGIKMQCRRGRGSFRIVVGVMGRYENIPYKSQIPQNETEKGMQRGRVKETP